MTHGRDGPGKPFAVPRDTPLERSARASDGRAARFEDVWVDETRSVTAVLWETDGVVEGSRGFTELIVVVEGSGRFAIGGREFRFAAGDLLIWPADTEAALAPDGRLRIVCVAYPFVRREDE
jgi:mannose-6-phosphate isomerase-like protein (cupin superfamily)